MIGSWLNLELMQLTELFTTALVAMASTASWLFLAGRP